MNDLRMIRHFPFRTGKVIAFDVFDVDVVVFVLQFTLVGHRSGVLAVAFSPFDFVRLGVFGQMIGSHEALVANRTSETFLARVGAQVTLEFIRSSETLAAK